MEKTYVIGHKNPDTDSICSAIGYANLKKKTEGDMFVPLRAGDLNNETSFVLDYFGVKAPDFVDNITTQVKDIEIRETEGITSEISIRNAWTTMQEAKVGSLAVISRYGTLEGMISVGDVAKSYMNILDNDILSRADTSYKNIVETIDGEIIVGDEDSYFSKGKVLIAAANPDRMEDYIDKNDMVILGDRYESQLCAIEMGAACIIVCVGAKVSMTIKKLAAERGCTIISTPYETFLVARLINQSAPVSYFMKTENLITFEDTEYIDDVREIMASKRYRDFPVVDEDGKYIGMISRRNLLGAKGKSIIMVDHNEENQGVEGLEYAEIKEIIDHHRIGSGSVNTTGPVFFRNQPLGCTATIVYQMFTEKCVEIEKPIAGILCSAIISDTLMFRSPTCTPMDKQAAEALAEIAGIDIPEYAAKMFEAGSDLRGKTPEELFYQDFKKFQAESVSFGVGQITSTNRAELDHLRKPLTEFMNRALEEQDVDMMFFMMTDILEESSGLLYAGKDAEAIIKSAFTGHMSEIHDENGDMAYLPGVVSRKKQLVPDIILHC